MKPVLDACCGSRMFWFDKKDSRCLFIDNRRGIYTTDVRTGRAPTIVRPNKLVDFTDMPFDNDSFFHVVFDPPHTIDRSSKTWTTKKYGTLTGDWKAMLKKGFSECFRVLKPNGTLIFKWSDVSVPVRDILALTPEKPLYGHKSGKQQGTHWIAFLKDGEK